MSNPFRGLRPGEAAGLIIAGILAVFVILVIVGGWVLVRALWLG